MHRFIRWSSLRWGILVLLLLACVWVGMLVVLRPARPAPVVVLRGPFQMPLSLRDRVERWLPPRPGWVWAWRLEEAVLGQRKPVNVCAEFVSLGDSAESTLAGLPLGAPSFSDTNGLQVWLLGADRLKALHEGVKLAPGITALGSGRLSMGEGMEGRLLQGNTISLNGSNNWVGLAVGCCGRVGSAATDLMASFTVSEVVTNEADAVDGAASLGVISIQTNLDAALRVQVPKGSGLFLVDGGPGSSGHKRVGVIIEPPQPKL